MLIFLATRRDLINSVHQDLATRVMGVDSSVRELREDLHIALPALYPVSGRTFRQTSALQPSSIDIPYTVQGRLEAMFARECGPNSARRLSLQQLTDCFLKHFETINVGYHLNMDPHNRMPPINRYLELLKCQFLMHKIRRSPNLAQAPQISHWHGYINSLQEVRLWLTCRNIPLGGLLPTCLCMCQNADMRRTC